ncbi:MAG: decaprenyl-phosphate phosphoribosyltransferase [Coriobacteriia bacterium]
MSIRDTLALVRIRQWSKNLAVYAAIIFSGELFDLHALTLVTAGFVAFCLTASALYVVNDILDAERDRRHPLKKNRPIASRRIEPIVAWGIAAALFALGLGLSVLLGVPFLLTIGAYLVLQLLYATWLKHALIVDMLVIGAGFVLRAVAGAEVISVPVSPWLVICTGLLALFLAAAKRRHELVLLEERSSSHRPVLAEYSVELLDSFMVTLSAATITTYALYTFFEVRSPNHTMMLTLPFVIYGLLRYQYLVLRREGGGRPEDVLLGDRPIIIDVALWIASAVFVLYALPHFIS